jgi:hypothetical protein
MSFPFKVDSTMQWTPATYSILVLICSLEFVLCPHGLEAKIYHKLFESSVRVSPSISSGV